jgi:hypothetical protein
MSEQVYNQVEDAIKRNLHLGTKARATSMFQMHWIQPVQIVDGNIEMRNSAGGLDTWFITPEEWAERVAQYGLWKMVGMWSFVPADDPAAAEIAFAHRCPDAAGQQLYRLKQRIAELEGV